MRAEDQTVASASGGRPARSQPRSPGNPADRRQADTRRQARPARGRRQWLFALAGLLALGAVAYRPALVAVADYLVIEDPLIPADVIHVIAGADDRTDYAIRLYQQGYGRLIFFTGGWCEAHGYFHGRHGVERAEAQGVRAASLALDESPVTSTYDEAVRLKEYIARSPQPIRSVIVVSDPYHMRRARWTYRQVLGRESTVLMAPVPAGAAPYQRDWWRDRAARQYVRDEYVKLAYYCARYRLSRGALQEWLVSLDRG